jgi:hypothetical protein
VVELRLGVCELSELPEQHGGVVDALQLLRPASHQRIALEGLSLRLVHRQPQPVGSGLQCLVALGQHCHVLHARHQVVLVQRDVVLDLLVHLRETQETETERGRQRETDSEGDRETDRVSSRI